MRRRCWRRSISGPGKRISGRDIFDNKRAASLFTITLTQEISKLDGGRKVKAVCVLKRPENAALSP
jgi:hypothetical protein